VKVIDAKAAAQTNGPFWSIALVLWALALVGAVLVLPYIATLEHQALATAAAKSHLSVAGLLAISMVQSAVLLGVAVVVGLWAARKLDLRTPLISALVSRVPRPKKIGLTLLVAAGLGVAVGFGLIALDHWLFAPVPSVAVLIRTAGQGHGPSAWQGLLASFYGALDEEILMRLGLLSLIALGLRTVARALGMDRGQALPPLVFWTANIATAVLFGLGHLPATAAIVPLTPVLVVRAIVLNGAAGIVYGGLFRRYGLEWAMISHFATDLVAHVAFA
jgi:hypothetical protein